MLPFHTIVAAVDFSETSQDALDAALELARERRARVHLLHVVSDVFHTPWMVESAGVDLQDVQHRWTEEAEQQLMTFAASHDLDPLSVTIAVAVGPAANEIVRYANEHAAGVIVLGSHGHGIIRRFVLGSVAERVIRQASCPVMVVPHRTLRLTSLEVKAPSSVEA